MLEGPLLVGGLCTLRRPTPGKRGLVRRFLSILEGSSPLHARPVLASEDPDLVRLVATEIAKRLGGDDHGSAGVLHLVRVPAAPGKDGEQRKDRDRSTVPPERPTATLQRSSRARSMPKPTPILPRSAVPRCAFCGKPFKRRRGGRPQRFCSKPKRCRWLAWDAAHPRLRA